MTGDGPLRPYLFVSGCPRSGTSVFKKILRGHPQLATVGIEHGYILELVDRLGSPAPSITEALDAFEAHHWGFGDGATPRSPDFWNQPLHRPIEWSEFYRLLHQFHAPPDPDAALVLQYPGPGVLRWPEVAALFPGAKLVVLERDPRANVASQLAAFDEQRSTLRSIRLWKQCVAAAGRYERDPSVRRLRFEDLVADPARHFTDVCDFIGVPWDDALVDFDVSMPDIAPDRSVKHRRFRELDARTAEKWRTGLSPHQVWLVEQFTSSEMQSLGYEPAEVRLRPKDVPRVLTDVAALVRERAIAFRRARR